MIQVTPVIAIDEGEILLEYVRSPGPGGQNVNKVATAVQLRYDVAGSRSLPDDIRGRLVSLSGRRLTKEGILVIEARRYRTQGANRQDAIERLITLIQKAAQKPVTRRKTRPGLASKMHRLETKRKHSETKKLRRPVSGERDG